MTRPVTTPGRLVAGRYRLQSQVGGGGMGTVWLARDELLGRKVAVKQVLTAAGVTEAEADQQRQRALREGRIAARLSHPHAISVYDVALESGQPWLVMEYLPSRSLAAVLTEDGVLRVDQVAQIGAQVADALAATHAAGIVHRDVKPANILIGEGGRIEGLVKITDFGISHASGDVTLTQTGQITGTPAFLAPEVAQGHEMTAASDVFSLGATLYTCIEGQPPFGMEDNALAMLHRVAGGSIVPPRRAGSLTEPLLRMLAADPADRPDMAAVRDELAKLAAGRDGDTTTVLLARTDIRSSVGGRDRTSAFPAEPTAAAAAPTPTPVPVPAASPPTRTDTRERHATADPAPAPVAQRPATAPPAREGRRRGRALWLLAGLAAVVIAGLVTYWAVVRDGDGNDASDTAAGPTTSAAATTDPGTDDEEPAPTSESEEPATTSEPEEPPAGDPAAATTQLFALIPGDLAAAYELTSPEFQANTPFENFSGFWDDYSSVQIANVRTESPTSALVDITYVESGGSSETESHRLRFVQGDDGRLLLLDDRIA
ncbi:serine/threonine-protein kinase [Blastococcus haudaquaticus]|uniref:non-specific serine/threonine protein kinase n=1 Tax=Blastococcus haudaquaticus TaxID=1938745 RepID=A0A286GY81_9ACTN|nr:serine/threonine-protein kinase [Blastococcus haudaquaticus]SOE00495.1 Serine/threonine protein kinase [Blastococcus haudaquaticus]